MVKREGMENLLLSYYEGETTEDETALVEEWLEASEENRRTARQVQTLGLAADMAQISSRLDVKKALEDVHRKMKQKKVNRYQVLFRGMQRAAAILFIPLMVSWSILYWDKDKEEIVQDVMLWLWENRERPVIEYSLKQYQWQIIFQLDP